MKTRTYVVQATWDNEAKMWVAESDDIPGVVAEAEDQETLRSKLASPDSGNDRSQQCSGRPHPPLDRSDSLQSRGSHQPAARCIDGELHAPRQGNAD